MYVCIHTYHVQTEAKVQRHRSCMGGCVCMCVYASVYACRQKLLPIYMGQNTSMYVSMHACVCVCESMYVCMHVCVCLCVKPATRIRLWNGMGLFRVVCMYGTVVYVIGSFQG
jgi:hypothetical protein